MSRCSNWVNGLSQPCLWLFDRRDRVHGIFGVLQFSPRIARNIPRRSEAYSATVHRIHCTLRFRLVLLGIGIGS